MKIYNVLWENEHLSTTATPFLNKEEAISWARSKAKERAPFEMIYKEDTFPGSLFFVRYSFGGACLWVTEHEVQT